MAILEYEPGAAFPGVIGRTAEESAPAVGSAATPGRLRSDAEPRRARGRRDGRFHPF